ncbi:MAG: tetratricopeptide repeat protein [Isosphaeraceae bacterium]
MSKASRPQKPSPQVVHTRRLNFKALVILLGVIVAALPGVIGIRLVQQSRAGASFLAQGRDWFEKKQYDRAVNYLNNYLALFPEDPKALDLKAQSLAKLARTPDQVEEAIQAHNRLLGAIPKLPEAEQGAKRYETRRRLIELSLKVPNRGQAPSVLAQANELIDKDLRVVNKVDSDAGAYRLRAQAHEELSDYTQDPAEKRAQLEAALKDYDRAEQIEPGDVDGARQLAGLYFDRLADPDKALELVNRVVKTSTNDPKKHAAALVLRSTLSLATRDKIRTTDTNPVARREALLKSAKADIYAALEVEPNNAQTRLAAADLELQMRQPDVARQHLKTLPEEIRNSSTAKTLEGRIDLLERRPYAAADAYRAGLAQVGGNDIDLTWRLVNLLLEQGVTDSTVVSLVEQYKRLAQTGLPIDPERRLAQVQERETRGKFLDAMLLLRSNRPADAISGLEAIRYKVPTDLNAVFFYVLGEAYFAVKDLPKARDAFQQSAERSTGSSGAYVAQAKVERALGREDTSITTLRSALAINPRDPEALAVLATILVERERQKEKSKQSWDEIEQLFATAAKDTTPDPDLAIVHANYLIATNRLGDALALLEQANALSPQATSLWIARANAARQMERPGESIELMDKAIKAAGPHAELYITKSAALVQKGEVNAARDTLNDGITNVPREQKPRLWKALADFDFRRKEYKLAKNEYEEWAKLEPSNPDARLALLETAIASDDEPGIARAVEAVANASGPRGYQWRYARIRSLIHPRGNVKPTDAQLDEALKLAQEIQKNDPQLPLGTLLEAQVFEARKQVDQAVSAYKATLKLEGGDIALVPLLALLIREHRDNAMDELRRSYAGTPLGNRLAQTEVQLRVMAGDKVRAESLVDQIVKGAPEGLDLATWQASVLKELGKPKEAIATLQTLIQRDQASGKPTTPVTWFQLLMLQVAERDPGASATIDRLRTAKLEPSLDFPDLTYALCYSLVGDNRHAADSFREAMRKWPTEASVVKNAVLFFERTGANGEAEAILRSVLARVKDQLWARRELAVLLAGRPNDRAAWEEAIALIGAEPRPNDQPDDLIARSRVYAASPVLAERKKAVGILDKLAKEDPNNPMLQVLLARLLQGLKQPAAAKEHAAKAALVDQPAVDAVMLYIDILLTLKENDLAEAQIDRLAKASPKMLQLVEFRARLLVNQGKSTEAGALMTKEFSERVTTAGDLAVGDAFLGLARQLDLKDAASKMSEKLATLGPRGKCLLAWDELLTGKVDVALKIIEEMGKAGEPHAATIALNAALRPNSDPRWVSLADQFVGDALKSAPSSPDLLDKQALVRHLQKKYEEEIATYRALIALNPSNRLFLNNMAWTLSEELAQPQEGLKWADEALQKLGPQAPVLDTRGVILTRLKKYPDAVRDLEAAVADMPNPTFLYHLAQTYLKMGKTDDARKTRDRAKEAGLTRDQLQGSELADWDAVMKL